MKWICSIIICFCHARLWAGSLCGIVTAAGVPVPYAAIGIQGLSAGAISDSAGHFCITYAATGHYTLQAGCLGYLPYTSPITLREDGTQVVNVVLLPDTRNLEEIVVSGVSAATTIRHNPIPVISVSPAQLRQTPGTNLVDILVRNVPGLTSLNTGPNISKPFIRGLGYNRVLTLYDGIRQEGQQWGDEHGLEIDNYGIARAEVIKGPASLIYGSDALAGVISLYPYAPTDTAGPIHLAYNTEYQTNNGLIGTSLALRKSYRQLSWVVRASHRLAKNYSNPIDGRVYLTGFREWNLSAGLYHTHRRGSSALCATLYNNVQGIPDGSRDSLTRAFTYQVADGDKDTLYARPIVPQNVLNSYVLPALVQHINHARIYSHHSIQLGRSMVDALLGIQQNLRSEFNHPTRPAQPGMAVQLRTLNYSLRVNIPVYKHVSLATGINGMLQANRNLNATDFPIPDYTLSEQGIYTHISWQYSKWTVSGGARFDRRSISWPNFFVATDPNTGFAYHIAQPADSAGHLQFPAVARMFTGVSAGIGSSFSPNRHITVKANIGRAYRAPNITELASNGLDPGAHIRYMGNHHFLPEFSLQQDLGLSLRYPSFSTDLSLFNNNISNYIFLHLLLDPDGVPLTDAQGNKTYGYSAAQAHLYGFECWTSWHPPALHGFRVDNSLSLLYGFNNDPAYRGQGIDGAYLPLMPPLGMRTLLSRSFSYSGHRCLGFTPSAELEYCARQGRYLALYNTESATSSYMLVNCSITATFRQRNATPLELTLSANNIFNTAYQSHLNRLKYFEYYTQSTSGHYGIYNMGRNIVVKATMPF